MQFSHRQEDIFNHWENHEDNILISACAGSGKTTTLLEIIKKCDARTLYLAFNKSIQQEVSKKLEKDNLRQGKALTMHSLGLQAIRGAGIKFRIDKNKNWSLINIFKEKYRSALKTSIPYEDHIKLFFALISLEETSRMNFIEDYEELSDILLEKGTTMPLIDNMEKYWERFRELREEEYQKDTKAIDFLDMIYLPIKWDLTIPVYPSYLIIDECQDLNYGQHLLIDKMISQGTIRKWVAAGDRNQSIYGFAGATSNSFELFLEKEGNTVEMPLDICYRSSKRIIDEANKVYDVMHPFKEDSGIVGTVNSLKEVKEGSMIICRNSNPLFQAYFGLLALDKPSYINGSDMMAYLIGFLNPYKYQTILYAKREMGYELEDLERDSSDRGQFKAFIFRENFYNFNIISSHLASETDKVEYLIDKLKDLFSKKENSIELCTIHKSKGLEADVVYILNENLIPSRFAKTGDQLIQEENLRYVARSRAKKELYYLNLEFKDE